MTGSRNGAKAPSVGTAPPTLMRQGERRKSMKYRVKVSDWSKDELITMEVEAPSVFDAIDRVADSVDNPEETELIEAVPVE